MAFVVEMQYISCEVKKNLNILAKIRNSEM
jgi:hypothetical protein